MTGKVRELFGIDLRSLALFRIGLGLVVLGDLISRMQDLTAHYSDDGIMPRDLLISTLVDPWYFSLHLINGSWQFQALLFFLTAIFALNLAIGYKTRLMTFLTWFFILSLHTRNPLVLQGGDHLLRLLLFWSLFLPLGAYWSIDQYQNKKSYFSPILSVATFALLMQICFVYWFTALLKTDDSWRIDGTAIWYSLSIEQYTTSFGRALLNYPYLLKFLTFATFYLEAFGPFFAFSPFWTGPLRCLTVLIFLSFHLIGINLTMELGLFPYVSAVAWIVFIPGWFWDKFLPLPSSLFSQDWKTSKASNILAIFFIFYIFLLNLKNLDLEIPFSKIRFIGSVLRLDQFWNMFAPLPIQEDGWYVIPAELTNGREIDLYKQGAPVSWKKPPLLSATYTGDRWRTYLMNLVTEEDMEVFVLYYAEYLCRQWNDNHLSDQQLLHLDITYMLRIIDLNNPNPVPEKVVLWSQDC